MICGFRDKSYHRGFLHYQEFPGEDELAVVVESDDQERNRQYVERLAAKLQLETNLFTDIFYKGDLKALGSKALLFAPEEDLTNLSSQLEDYRPFIGEFTAATNLDSLFNLINEQFRTAKREASAANLLLVKAIPALQRIIAQAQASLVMPGIPVSPGVAALFGAGDEAESEMYITFAGGRIYLLTARACSEDLNSDAVERMRELMRQTDFEAPGVNTGLTGEPVLDYDEMQQSKHDATLATIVSLIVSSLLFIYAYRQLGRPLKTVLCLVIGLGYSMAFTTLVIGHLNILTITFAPILIGLAIDFGIHFITRYEEESRHGRSREEALDKAIVFTGQGIVIGALTTAFAFLAMWIPDFKGIQEMGVISGGGLILCLVPMMTMLPALLMLEAPVAAKSLPAAAPEANRARIESFWLRRPGIVMAATALLCALAATQFSKVYFDYNLLHMQSQRLASVIYEKKLLFSGQSVLYAAVEADTLEQARQFEQAVLKLPSVASVDGSDHGEAFFDMLTRDQTRKLEWVKKIEGEVSSFHFAPADTLPVDLNELGSTLWQTMGYLDWAIEETQKDKDTADLSAQLRSLRDAISDFRVQMLRGRRRFRNACLNTRRPSSRTSMTRSARWRDRTLPAGSGRRTCRRPFGAASLA